MQSCPLPPQLRRPFPDRLVAAIRLDPTVYEEVEHDEEAMGQAFWIVVLAALAQGLALLNPAAVLERGYAIVTDGADHVVTDASSVAPGSTITARLARGPLQATVVAAVAAPPGTTDGDPT